MKITEYNADMSEVVPYPDREINDGQKQLFTQAIERLEDFIHLDVPTVADIAECNKAQLEEFNLYKEGTFVMDETRFVLGIFEAIDDSSSYLRSARFWSVEVHQPPVLVGGSRFNNQEYYIVGCNYEGEWAAEYEKVTYVEDFGGRIRRCWPEPIDLDEEEMAENESEVSLEERFTQQRFTDLLHKLVELNAFHIVAVP